MAIHGYAAYAAAEALRPFQYDAQPLGDDEVEVAISHCGICHSDLHLIDNDWGVSSYPFIPGHEIVGTVEAAGSRVTHLDVGQRVGIGWQCGSCTTCEWCLRGEEACCPRQEATCVGRHGGFAEKIRVSGRFVFPLPGALSSAEAAPLLCAGLTVYTPLHHHAHPEHTIGVVGIGGLGHLALQFARAMGCRVIAFSSSPDKEVHARTLGATEFATISDRAAMQEAANSCDLLLNTVSAQVDWPALMGTLRPKGTLIVLGGPPGDVTVPVSALIDGDRGVRGSATGSRSTMIAMLDFAARHRIAPRVEVMPLTDVNAALDRVRANKARYRVVLEVVAG